MKVSLHDTFSRSEKCVIVRKYLSRLTLCFFYTKFLFFLFFLLFKFLKFCVTFYDCAQRTRLKIKIIRFESSVYWRDLVDPCELYKEKLMLVALS